MRIAMHMYVQFHSRILFRLAISVHQVTHDQKVLGPVELGTGCS